MAARALHHHLVGGEYLNVSVYQGRVLNVHCVPEGLALQSRVVVAYVVAITVGHFRASVAGLAQRGEHHVRRVLDPLGQPRVVVALLQCGVDHLHAEQPVCEVRFEIVHVGPDEVFGDSLPAPLLVFQPPPHRFVSPVALIFSLEFGAAVLDVVLTTEETLEVGGVGLHRAESNVPLTHHVLKLLPLHTQVARNVDHLPDHRQFTHYTEFGGGGGITAGGAHLLLNFSSAWLQPYPADQLLLVCVKVRDRRGLFALALDDRPRLRPLFLAHAFAHLCSCCFILVKLINDCQRCRHRAYNLNDG